MNNKEVNQLLNIFHIINEVNKSQNIEKHLQEHPFLDFNGFGGLAKYLLQKQDTALIEQIKRFENDFKIQGLFNSIKQSVLTSFFTPDSIIEAQVLSIKTLAEKSNTPIRSILEPAAGNGRYIKYLRKHFPEANIYGLEKDKFTAAVLKYNFLKDQKVITKNISFEDINKQNWPKEFDLIISNIPFGSIKIFDPEVNPKPISGIHNFYFLKAEKLAHQNTVISFLTSTGFLDAPKNKIYREQLSENLNLINALRLPNNIFKEANTKVVTDIITFQKKSELSENNSIAFIENSIPVYDYKNPEDENSYLDNINECFKQADVLGNFTIGGMYKAKELTLISDLSLDDISQKIYQRQSSFNLHPYNLVISKDKPDNILQHQKPEELKIPKENLQNPSVPELNDGNLFINTQGKIFIYIQNQEPIPYHHYKDDINKLATIIQLRDTYKKLLFFGNEHPDFSKLLHELHYLYDGFLFQYGPLFDKQNINSLKIDKENYLFDRLEKNGQKHIAFSEEHYQKTPALSENIIPVDLKTAIENSLDNDNSINLKYISKQTGLNQQDIISKGINEELIFIDPVFKENQYTGQYNFVPKDIFYSGHIQNKINFFKSGFPAEISYLNKSYLDYVINNLEDIKPPLISFEQMNMQLGEPWLPLKYVKDFVYEQYKIFPHIEYNETLDRFFIQRNNSLSFGEQKERMSIEEDFSFKAVNGITYRFENFLDSVLNSQIPEIKKTISVEPKVSVIYKPHMVKYQTRTARIEKDFQNYVLHNPELKKELEQLYYERYNAYLIPNYQDRKLTIPKLGSHIILHQNQIGGIHNIIKNTGGVTDHKVGFGKTYTAAASALKLKSMGKIQKALMLCIKANIYDIENDLKEAFPGIDILCVSNNSFDKENINDFLLQIKNFNGDLILITHDNFIQIPQDREIMEEIFRSEINDIDKNLDALDLRYDQLSTKMKKGLEKRKSNLEANLKLVNHLILKRKKGEMTFKNLGIDYLMIDESHNFKNLIYNTRHSRVAGLNKENGSERSLNLLSAIRTIQQLHNADKGITFFSGTVISNSITELYNIFKYIIPRKLEDMKIGSFDQWVKVFAEKEINIEKKLSGEYTLRERFRRFKNVPELSKLYASIAHVAHFNPDIIVPILNNIHDISEPFPDQKIYFDKLEQFARTGDVSLLDDPKALTKNYESGVSLVTFNYMIKASLDMRLINENHFTDNPFNRIRNVAHNIVKEYNNSNHFNGSQLVFIDKSTPKKEFNIYHELKRVLIQDYSIPENLISFIHLHDKKTQKKELFKKVNKGELRILFGSTGKLGTGVNAQERLIALHHFDTPFRPSDFEQRIGRAIRKGNLFAFSHNDNKVNNYIYGTKGSVDTKLFELIAIKDNFIKQILRNSLNSRVVDEGPIQIISAESININAADLAKLTSNDDDYIELQSLNQQLDDLRIKQDIFKSDLLNSDNKLANLNSQLDKDSETLNKLIKDKNLFLTVFPNFNPEKPDDFIFDNSKYSFFEKNDTQQILYEKFVNPIEINIINNNFNTMLFSYADSFEIGIRGIDKDNYKIIVKTPNLTYSYGSSQVVENQKTMLHYPLNAVSKSLQMIPQYKNNIEDKKQKIEVIHNRKKETFTPEDENKMKELEKKIKTLSKSIELKQARKNRGEEGKGNAPAV